MCGVRFLPGLEIQGFLYPCTPRTRWMKIELVKTALLGRWEIVNIGKDGLISKHIKEITQKQMYAIMIDSVKSKIKEMPEGFIINIDEYVVDVSKKWGW